VSLVQGRQPKNVPGLADLRDEFAAIRFAGMRSALGQKLTFM